MKADWPRRHPGLKETQDAERCVACLSGEGQTLFACSLDFRGLRTSLSFAISLVYFETTPFEKKTKIYFNTIIYCYCKHLSLVGIDLDIHILQNTFEEIVIKSPLTVNIDNMIIFRSENKNGLNTGTVSLSG